MENLLDTNVESAQNLQLDENSISYLNETRKWTLFISIVAFIGMGIAILVFFGLMVFTGSIGSGMYGSVSPALALIPMLIILVIYFFPIYYLFMFSRNAKLAVQNLDSVSLNNALGYLKSHYKFMGILLIVVLSIYALLFLVVAVTGGMAAFMR